MAHVRVAASRAWHISARSARWYGLEQMLLLDSRCQRKTTICPYCYVLLVVDTSSDEDTDDEDKGEENDSRFHPSVHNSPVEKRILERTRFQRMGCKHYYIFETQARGTFHYLVKYTTKTGSSPNPRL